MSDEQWLLDHHPWDVLGRYNAEKARGILHTEEWQTRMVDLQRQFDDEQHDALVKRGMVENDGIWMGTERVPLPWWKGWWRR